MDPKRQTVMEMRRYLIWTITGYLPIDTRFG